MSNLKWNVFAQAPSNIALIKYMGKIDSKKNIPENPSISLTLKNLQTVVDVHFEESSESLLTWSPFPSHSKYSKENFITPSLNDFSKQKIWDHFIKVKNVCSHFFPEHHLEIKNFPLSVHVHSANTFPESSGIASSASSFAALTLAFAGGLAAYSEKNFKKFQSLFEKNLIFKEELAKLSRQGSGSSCRSFLGSWVHWEKEEVTLLDSKNFPEVAHFVILVSHQAKEISSSQAHLLVKTSPLWEGRISRVCKRVEALKNALYEGNWNLVSSIAWEEMWEMHSLFHTCSTPFTYWEPETINILKWVKLKKSFLTQDLMPPIVTMDAGPNVHFIVPEKNRDFWKVELQKQFSYLSILEDGQGYGPNLQLEGIGDLK